MKVKSESEVTQLRPTLSDPMDCSPAGSSIHGIFQARVLECQWALALGKPSGLLWVGPGLPVQQAGPTWTEAGCRGPGLHVPPCYIPSPSTPGPGAEKTGCLSCPLCPSHQSTANWSPVVLSCTGFVFFPVKVWGFSPGLQPACDAVQQGGASVLLMCGGRPFSDNSFYGLPVLLCGASLAHHTQPSVPRPLGNFSQFKSNWRTFYMLSKGVCVVSQFSFYHLGVVSELSFFLSKIYFLKNKKNKFFCFLGFNITVDSDCSHEMKRCLLLRRKAMTT